MQLDCKACNERASMSPTKVPRFSGVVRTIGGILLVPSFIGFAIAAVFLISTLVMTADVMSSATNETQQTAAALGSAIGIGFSLVVGVVSLVSGLLGWLLLLKRNVYKCVKCDSIIDRG